MRRSAVPGQVFEADQIYRQISLQLSHETGEIVGAEKAGEKMQNEESKAMQTSLLSSSPTWIQDTHCQFSPFPIVVTKQKLQILDDLHDLLTTAIVNIVERWWTDKEARFPERMPIEQYEGDLLRVGTQNLASCY